MLLFLSGYNLLSPLSLLVSIWSVQNSVLIVAAIGFSGSGKTTTIEYLIEHFTALGYRVGAVKHIHHLGFTIDTQGKNTWRFSQAGARVVVAVSPQEVAVIKKTGQEIADLDKIISMLKDEELDIVFVEGLHWLIAKNTDITKIVVAKDHKGLKDTLEETVEPIIGVTGLVTKNANAYDFEGLPFVKIPEEGEKIITRILHLMQKKKDT